VTRTVHVQQLPTKEVVEKALRDVPEIKGIHYYDVHPEAEQPCCWPLMKKVQPPSHYEFSYYSDRVAVGNIAILENTRGEKIV